jgi:mannose-6-phosphate isomerase
VVRNGPLAGTPLHALVAAGEAALIGRPAGGRFPLLVKILDAAHPLSIQVHPDEPAAAEFGGEAKSEAWYVLQAEPGARVLLGARDGVRPPDIAAALKQGDAVEDLFRALDVWQGMVIPVPAGQPHSIGAGCLLFEVQQNSDTTYRLYDFGRRGPDGKPRELHTERALRVMRFAPPPPPLSAFPDPETPLDEGWDVLRTPHFMLGRRVCRAVTRLRPPARSFLILFCEHGSALIASRHGDARVAAGTTCLIPAGLEDASLEPGREGVAFVTVRLP